MRLTFLTILLLLLFSVKTEAQFLNKLKEKVKAEILGESTNENTTGDKVARQEEPSCACSDAVTVFQFGGNLKVNYRETAICTTRDGKILLQDLQKSGGQCYYVSEKGQVSGPFDADSPKLKQFNCFMGEDISLYPEHVIARPDYKFLIRFGGKEYGPYAAVNSFFVSPSGDKFLALAMKDFTENASDEDMEDFLANLNEKLKEAMENPSAAGDVLSASGLEVVTNIKDVDYDLATNTNNPPSATIKYDNICIVEDNQVSDLTGKTLMQLGSDVYFYGDNLWISSDNKKYAWYDYGTLTFSDGKKLNEISNPGLQKDGNTVYLSYLYYSPGDDAIKMCKVPF